MRARWLAGCGLRALVAPLVVAGVLTGLGQGDALASACATSTGTAWKQVPSPSPGSDINSLNGVAAVSSCQAWAVGEYLNTKGPYHTLIERWNGAAWQQVPSPSPGIIGNTLSAVAATSATNAWAVGDYINNSDTAHRTLIEHWNGTAWKQVPSPNPSSTYSVLFGVTATSATNAWAIGQFNPIPGAKPLILHWNGITWKQVPSPNPGGALLSGITATSSANAWAVGGYSSNGHAKTLILRWTGTAWKQVPSPNPGESVLSGVAATSVTNIWAVGNYVSSSGNKTLTVHCC